MRVKFVVALSFLLCGIWTRAAVPELANQPVLTLSGARLLLLSGHMEQAGAQVISMLLADPDDATLLTLLGDIQFRQSAFQAAAESYRQSIHSDGTNGRAYLGLARLDMLSNDKEAAAEHLETAFQLDPRDPEVLLNRLSFVPGLQARAALFQQLLALPRGRELDGQRLEDAAAQLQIAERLGQREMARLVSPYRGYRLKLTGYFPDNRIERGLLVQVSLNGGKPLQLILDSGADGIFVDTRRAHDAKLERLAAGGVTALRVAHETAGYVALAHRVQLGSLELQDCLVHVMDSRSFLNADGVIGMNVFEKFLIQINPGSHSLELMPFAAAPTPVDAIPVYRADHFLLLNALLENQREGYFLLDTGASFSVIGGQRDHEAQRGAKVSILAADGFADGVRIQPMRLGLANSTLVDEKPVQLDLTELSRWEGVEISGIIGYPMLKRSTLTINYRDARVVFGERF